jgi:hypothetical protein
MKSTPIGQEQLERYQRDGAVLLKGVLAGADIETLEAGVEEAFHGAAQGGPTTTVEQGGKTVVRDYASRDNSALRELIYGGVVGKLAARLMQTPSAQLILDQIFYKQQGPIVPTPWHQDTPFLRVRGDELVRLWLPCDPSPRNLTVQVVRGSHRWNAVYNAGGIEADNGRQRSPDQGVGDAWLPFTPDVRRYRDSFDILSWDVEPGDVLAFQGNMLHGSDGSTWHDRPRRALAVLLGGPALRYHVPSGKAFPSPGRYHKIRERDDIPHGAPIGDYRDYFPFCWGEPG